MNQRDFVHEAITAAGVGWDCPTKQIIEAFLQYMDRYYVGDMEIEHACGYLLQIVRDGRS